MDLDKKKYPKCATCHFNTGCRGVEVKINQAKQLANCFNEPRTIKFKYQFARVRT